MASGVKPRVKATEEGRSRRSCDHQDPHQLTRWNRGQRKDKEGNTHSSRSIINRFVPADFNGKNVIDVTLEPAISTNPYFEFEADDPRKRVSFKFTWYDDDGSDYETDETR